MVGLMFLNLSQASLIIYERLGKFFLATFPSARTKLPLFGRVPLRRDNVAVQRQGTRFKSGTVTPLSGDTSSKPLALARAVPATGSQESGRPE